MKIAKNFYIVAGPRSSGKSTFIDWLLSSNSLSELPSELANISTVNKPVYFKYLKQLEGTFNQTVLIHVDIFAPFADCLINSEESLTDILTAAGIERYPYSNLLKEAENINILTLRTPRIITLQRWLKRCVDNKNRIVRVGMAQICSDAYGEKAYEHLYNAWDRFVSDIPNGKKWDVREAEGNECYSITPA